MTLNILGKYQMKNSHLFPPLPLSPSLLLNSSFPVSFPPINMYCLLTLGASVVLGAGDMEQKAQDLSLRRKRDK